ncbi:MAG: rRNA pseudouridine synthase [Ruminococcaceae bacterium]|nr:rRNA pseudouridine synthase [Oscillospiraceae bacterium]
MNMRLDKFFTSVGLLSRSETQRAVRAKRIFVNGAAAKKADVKIDPEKDIITLDGEQVLYREFTYIMLNKPKGYISATDDSRLPTVMELLPEKYGKLGLFPCGRLDRDTTGLMLLTDDGELAHFLLSPVSHVPKTYYFECRDELCEISAEKLADGVDIGEKSLTKPAALEYEGKSGRITVSEGRYHQIKRMFEAIGNEITYLERVTFGPLTLDPALARGEWRELTENEIKEIQKHNRNIKEN